MKKEKEALQKCVVDFVKQYMNSKSNNDDEGMYRLVIKYAQAPAVETVIQQTGINIKKSARILKISENTLRKILRKHFGEKYFHKEIIANVAMIK